MKFVFRHRQFSPKVSTFQTFTLIVILFDTKFQTIIVTEVSPFQVLFNTLELCCAYILGVTPFFSKFGLIAKFCSLFLSVFFVQNGFDVSDTSEQRFHGNKMKQINQNNNKKRNFTKVGRKNIGNVLGIIFRAVIHYFMRRFIIIKN